MASQTPAKCQFCEESSVTDSQCIECDLFFCAHCCQRWHSKSKSSKSHQIINLKDFETEDVAASHRQVDLNHMTCTDHEGQKCFSFCSQCNKIICFLCLKEGHSDHNLSDIQKVYDNKISKMKQLRTEIDTDLPFFQAENHKLQKSLSDLQKDKDEVTKKIKDREQMLKDAVSKYAQDLLSKCDSIYKASEVKMHGKLSNTQKNEKELTQRRNQLTKDLESFKASDILNESQVFQVTLPEKTEIAIQVPKTEFIPAEIKDIDLFTRFGDVCEINDLQLVETYETNVYLVNSILHCSHNANAFIGSRQKLQEVTFEEDRMVVVKEKNIDVYDMAMMDNGDILISSGYTKLRLNTKYGALKPYKDFSPFTTTGVHVNKNKQILIGLTEKEIGEIKPNSISRVVVLNQRGEIIHTYEFDRDNQRLFTSPVRITTMNDDIYVIDILDSGLGGRVVVVGYGGQVKWVYTGGDKQKSVVDKFNPAGITVSTGGLVLISDMGNHMIHVLSQTGDLITCHQVSDLGIEHPFSLSIGGSGSLWVGCITSESEKIQKAKLYKLRFC